jgi:hypothetical protein
MSLSLSEAQQRLLSGDVLPWTKFRDNKAGSVQLATPGERRLLHYLLVCDQTRVAEANESLFEGLVAAWENTAFDPASANALSGVIAASGPWRLARLEASGFGGLNLIDGPIFEVPFSGANWCLEGQNGSGKTSIASAIIWAITGYRCRDQDGLFQEQGLRTPVYNDSGVQIGDWPAIVAYPSSAIKLAGAAETWVRLTFQDPNGNSAEAYRRLVAAPGTAPVIEAMVSPELLAVPQLLEVGLLMPARLARIGFGEKSQTIYDAVKLLTGLDQLAAIAEGAANLSHKSKRFMKYALDNGTPALEARMKLLLERANEEAKKTGFNLKIDGKREDKSYARELRDIAKQGAEQAATHLSVLVSDIASTLDINNTGDRAKIKNAVSAARGILQNSSKGVIVFDAWKALREAHNDTGFQTISDVLADARQKLAEAIVWNNRQSEDHKLRLKALASQFFEPTAHEHEDADCPLCEGKLSGEKRKELAAELSALKGASAAAERKLEDVCAALEKKIHDMVPVGLNLHFALVAEMQPYDAFLVAVKEVFSEAAPFSTVLTGIATFASKTAPKISQRLPTFAYAANQVQAEVPPAAQGLVDYICDMERVAALVAWWHTHRQQFASGWKELNGVASEAGDFPAESLEGKLASLEAALEKAMPLDDLAKALNDAASEADKWLPIHEKQKIREAIAMALEPLKDLRLLVATETASSISSLSGRMKQVLERIHFRERLAFEDAALNKKAVQVTASFNHGILIDAAVVANSSWLRAILWAFVLALREQAIEDAGANPFPLMVLDDPQITFDPRNKGKWAEEIARLGNADPASAETAQVIVISHERRFFQMLVNLEKLTGQHGMVVRLCDTSKVATIINGDSLAHAYDTAFAQNDDEKGHAYVQKVRTYCEDLLKIMLRAEGPEVCDLTLDTLVGLMKTRRKGSVPPFTNPSFEKLINAIGGSGGGKPMNLINDAHHKFDGTIGLAQATDVKAFWEKQVQSLLHTCFKIFAEFEAHVGEPRLFAWMDNVVEMPAGNAVEMKTLHFVHTGVAAAAKTDGRAGDGIITMSDLSEAQKVTLHNHDAYQLAAGTLDPVADVGDVIIVSNYAKVHARDLVVAAFESRLLARRYNETDIHPHIMVLTGQATDPTALAQPVIAPKERTNIHKVVGTLFAKHKLSVPPKDDNVEFIALPNLSVVHAMLRDAKLFQVDGRSAEPIALDGQFIMTQPIDMTSATIRQMAGRLVIAVDENGARYLKRFRPQGGIVVLESLNPDGTAPAELLSFQGEQGLPKLAKLLEVVGILFELP